MDSFINGLKSWCLVIVKQAEIHRFFIKSSILMIVFLATSVLSQAFVLMPFDAKSNEAFVVRTAELEAATKSKMYPEEKLAVLKAKVEAAKYSKNLSQSAADLITTLMKEVIRLAIVFFSFGLASWVWYSLAVKKELQGSGTENSNKALKSDS